MQNASLNGSLNASFASVLGGIGDAEGATPSRSFSIMRSAVRAAIPKNFVKDRARAIEGLPAMAADILAEGGGDGKGKEKAAPVEPVVSSGLSMFCVFALFLFCFCFFSCVFLCFFLCEVVGLFLCLVSCRRRKGEKDESKAASAEAGFVRFEHVFIILWSLCGYVLCFLCCFFKVVFALLQQTTDSKVQHVKKLLFFILGVFVQECRPTGLFLSGGIRDVSR